MIQKVCSSVCLLFMGIGMLMAQEQKTALPTLYITTDNYVPINSKDVYVSGHMTVVSKEDTSGIYNDVMEIRGRGNSTWGKPKKPYRIKLNEKFCLLGMPAKEKSWVLLANYADKTLMRNALAFEISKACGIYYTPAYRFVDVVLNNSYIGNYTLADQIERNKNRVDIEKLDSTQTNLPEISGGFLLEVDGFGNTSSIPSGANFPEAFKTDKGNIVSIKYPKEEDILASQRNYIIQYFNTFESVMNDYDSSKDSFSIIEQYLDVQAFVNWYIATELTANPDCIFSIYVKKHRNDDRLYFAPIWDNDISFGNCNRLYSVSDDGRAESIMVRCFSNNNFKSIVAKILSIPEIKQAIALRWIELRPGMRTRLLNFINETEKVLDASQKINFQKWNILNYVVYNELTARGSYAAEVAFLREYMGDRFDYLDAFFSAMANVDPQDPEEPEEPIQYRFTPEKHVPYKMQCLLNGRYLIATRVDNSYQLSWSNTVPTLATAAAFYVTTEKDSNGNEVYYFKNSLANAYIHIQAAKTSIELNATQKTAFTLYNSPNSTEKYFGLSSLSSDDQLNGLGIDLSGEVVSWPTTNHKTQREYRFIADTRPFSTTFHSIGSNDWDDLSNWENGAVNAYTQVLTIAPDGDFHLCSTDTIAVDTIVIQAGGNIQNEGFITAQQITFLANDSAVGSLLNLENGSYEADLTLCRRFEQANRWYPLAFPFNVENIGISGRSILPLSHYLLMTYSSQEAVFDTLSYAKSKMPKAGAYLFGVKNNLLNKDVYFKLDVKSPYSTPIGDYVFIGNTSLGKITTVGDQTFTYEEKDTCFVLRKDVDLVEIPPFTSYFTTVMSEALDTIYVYPKKEVQDTLSCLPNNMTAIKAYGANGCIVIQNLPVHQSVWIYDLSGRKVAQAVSDGKEISIPIKSGVYVIYHHPYVQKLRIK